MPKLAMFCTIQLKPGAFEEWWPIGQAHAKFSRENEPGTLRFEVMQAVDRDRNPIPDRILVHELYQDEAAFAAHGRSASMRRIIEANERLVEYWKSTHAFLD